MHGAEALDLRMVKRTNFASVTVKFSTFSFAFTGGRRFEAGLPELAAASFLKFSIAASPAAISFLSLAACCFVSSVSTFLIGRSP